jgi:pimeloyl-ACP methyl ester carboxylesterase
MSKGVRLVRTIIQLLALAIFGALLAILRFFYETPQPLESVLPGEDRLYKWTFGHVFYKVIGEENSSPLVLLHAPGIGNSSYEMRSVVQSLAQHYRVYALDLLGFGLSDRPAIGYTGDLYVQLCRDFLADVVARPATLMASGLSCNYAVAMVESAESSSSLCERLVLISPLALFEYKQPPTWLRQVLQNRALAIAVYAFLTTRFILRNVIAWQRVLDYKHISKEDLDDAFASAHQFGAQHASLAQIAGGLYVSSRPGSAIQQPTLIIWGVHALSRTRDSINQHAISTQTQVVLIQDAGVQAHEEAPGKVVANVLEWVAEETPQALARVQEAVSASANASATSASLAQATSADVASPFTQEHADTIPVELAESAIIDNVAEDDARTIEGATEDRASGEDIEAYCVKCRQKRVIRGARKVTTKNGRNAVEGTCPVCGTRLFRFVAR